MEIKQYKELLTYWHQFTYFTNCVIGKKSTILAKTTFDLDEHLKLYHCIDNFFYVLADSVNHTIVKVGGGIESLTGYQPSDFEGKGYYSTLKTHSIWELLKITKGGVKYFEYLFSRPAEDRKYIKVNYTFELKRKDGRRFQCINQSIPVLFNDDMEPIYFLNIITDISLIKTDKNVLHYIIDSSDIQNIKRIDINVAINLPINDDELISKAEKRVLRLIADGLSSKQIASELFLSQHTINTHRRNMLEKLNCTSSSEMIKKGILNGWL